MNRTLFCTAIVLLASPLWGQRVGDDVLVKAPTAATLAVQGRVVGSIPRGTPLTIQELRDDDASVTWQGVTGWITKSAILPARDSIDFFGKAIEQHPHASDYCARGYAYLWTRQYERAITDSTEAVRRDPKYVLAYRCRAEAYGRKREWGRAIADLTEVLRLDPSDAWAYSLRAYCHSETGNRDAAIGDYTVVIRLATALPEWYCGRGYNYALRGELDKAIADYSAALSIAPNNERTHYNRGWAYAEKGAFDKAISDFTEAIRLSPADANVYCHRSNAYVLTGELERAISDLDVAVRLRPDWLICYELRGALRIERGDYARGIKDIRTAIHLNPNDPAATFEAWPKGALTAEALEHGSKEVHQMLKDRPAMAQHGDGAERLYAWAARKFAGEDLYERIYWDAADPTEGTPAANYPPTEQAPGCIRLRPNHAGVQNKNNVTDFEELWRNAVFELYNITNAKEFALAKAEAAKGLLSKDQFIARIHHAEFRAAQKTRTFYVHVYLPWAKEHRVPTRPGQWYIGGPSPTVKSPFERQISRQYDSIILARLLEKRDVQGVLKLSGKMLSGASTGTEKAQLYCARASAYALMGDLESASAESGEAIQVDPKWPEAYYIRGYARWKSEDLNGVIADESEAIRLNPKLGGAYYERGVAYDRKGESAKAKADFEQAKMLGYRP